MCFFNIKIAPCSEFNHKITEIFVMKVLLVIMLWAKNDERLLNFYKKQGFSVADDFVVMFKNSG